MLCSIETSDQSDFAHQLLNALIKIAPTGKDQSALSSAYNDAAARGYTDDGTSHSLLWAIDTLATGVKFNNWPWTKLKVNEA